MNQHQQINAAFDREYTFLGDAILISPSALAHRVFEIFSTGDEDAHIQYTSLEHLKHMARVYLASRKDADGEMNEAHGAQGHLDLGVTFSGKLQDRYPMPRVAGEEPSYKLRAHLTAEERAYNVQLLRKSARTRLEHADALEAEGQVAGAA